MDMDKTRADALRLAQETNSVGSIWNAQKVDDFERIPGISGTFEQRLYSAGVSTFKDLAGCTPEQLAEICKPPSTMLPNYPAWIAKAKELAG
jgi:predicted flap endonuclease-1-like 5' DNA nuclease